MAVRDPLVAAVHRHHLSRQDLSEADRLAASETILGHRFARPDVLREALTHRSAAHGGGGGGKRRKRSASSNERLEFVGDRVLGLLIAEWLIERFPLEQEGDLGRRLAALVSQPVLAGIAEALGWPDVLAVSSGESRVGVRQRATVLADALEAALGALFLDGGLQAARAFVRRAWEPAMAGQVQPPKDAKTALQEWAQARGHDLPLYRMVSREGPPHAPRFVIAVALAGEQATGEATTKRAGEQLAAAALLDRLTPPPPPPQPAP
ncbi:MAG: ribonuclease III [Acidisphaera sp.]|nr:ribonuclease III [Acidisphaera sp.]MBV9813603.1 ribonuclease III [Acetobacteraceae bacterium]